ncbi:hypothetical protein [Pseudomonas khavaziana]|uniref:Uncharacterized protein n=1 Tax=Pseudomonas khavaziana TaxID=2842351 RepID=A0ABZ2DHD3_9PSED
MFLLCIFYMYKNRLNGSTIKEKIIPDGFVVDTLFPTRGALRASATSLAVGGHAGDLEVKVLYTPGKGMPATVLPSVGIQAVDPAQLPSVTASGLVFSALNDHASFFEMRTDCFKGGMQVVNVEATHFHLLSEPGISPLISHLAEHISCD